MAYLDLSPEETESLRGFLENALSDLRVEISHTDSLDFRRKLKAKKALLHKVLDTLVPSRQMV